MKPLLLYLLIPFLSMPSTEAAKNYNDALAKSILFYDAQRSGKLPANNPIPWRGDSALNDCVPGGWYDAGDHLKFGLPLSATVTTLAWSLVKFKDGYSTAGQLNNMYDMIKWPLDYMLKAWDAGKHELVVQVGDGDSDHDYWGRPEDMTMSRPCKRVNQNTHGSDIAGGTAAALAAGSIAFKDKGDTTYANQLLSAAKSLYTFAKSYRGVYSGSDEFYGSSGDRDELCMGAVWLYKATNDNTYLNDAKGFGETDTAWNFDWDDRSVGCQALLYETTQDSKWRTSVNNFLVDWQPGGSLDYTPCGLAWRTKWGSASCAANGAFIALIAAELDINPSKNRQWAVEQINYILGDNHHDGGCYSYEVGYGSKYPKQPHHAAASCPNPPASCDWDNFDSPNPNPHVINGALVGGPDQNDNYKDDRGDYVMNEVAIDYNAGFQGALAGIVHLQDTNNLPTSHNKCPCSQ